MARRSGELFMLPTGTRLGILEGDFICVEGAVAEATDDGATGCRNVAALLEVLGVFACVRGGGPRMTLAGRGGGADFAEVAVGFVVVAGAGVFDLGGRPLGVFDLGGGALTSDSASRSSSNLSP